MDSEKLKKAIVYVDRMSSGCNPVNNEVLDSNHVLNNPNVIRCMYFIKDVLLDVYKNNKKTVYKKAFDYCVLSNFKYENDKTITHLFKQINSLDENSEPLKFKPIIDWLKENDYLEVIMEDDKSRTIVTEKGKRMGLRNEYINSRGRVYFAVIYNEAAQDFIVNNLENINKIMMERK